MFAIFPSIAGKYHFVVDFETRTMLHTQEVTGSSPAVSTKKILVTMRVTGIFLFLLFLFC